MNISAPNPPHPHFLLHLKSDPKSYKPHRAWGSERKAMVQTAMVQIAQESTIRIVETVNATKLLCDLGQVTPPL